MKNYQNDDAKNSAVGFLGLALALGAMALMTGCSGLEVGGKLGLYRVDERAESQRTYRQSIPWKCYFVNCQAAPEDVQGS